LTKPILVYDFDGVIHSYKSGWKGATVIPDPPVPGALEHIVRSLEFFHPAVFSSRSHQWGGIGAMKRYIYNHLTWLGGCDPMNIHDASYRVPEWWADYIAMNSAMEPWTHEVHHASKRVIREIKWPIFKPAAIYSIDDRGHQFDGTWPDHQAIATFKPWNKRAA
jgi:hypothetical protein